jgi:spore germination protein KB
VESLLDVNYTLIVIIKIEVCIYGAAKAIAEVFNLQEYKMLVYSLSALTVSLAVFIQKSSMESEYVATQLVPAINIPVLVLFPIIVLIVSLCKKNNSPDLNPKNQTNIKTSYNIKKYKWND